MRLTFRQLNLFTAAAQKRLKAMGGASKDGRTGQGGPPL